MSDPILLFLLLASVALLVLGALTRVFPRAPFGFLAAAICGLGLLLCLPPLAMRLPSEVLTLPVGPPNFSLRFALDPLTLAFLVLLFLVGAAIAAFHATALSAPHADSARMIAFSVGGAAVGVLAADGIALTLGLAAIIAAIRPRAIAAPFLMLAAICLLTPPGYAPRFDAIRAAPIEAWHGAIALILTVGVVGTMLWPNGQRQDWTTETLNLGLLVPLTTYLLLRVGADLSATALLPWCGFVPLLAGSAAAIGQAWTATSTADIDTATGALIRRQAGLATASFGLFLIARTADLSAAAIFALNATFLTAVGVAVAGTLTSLAAHAIGGGAGTYRLSRLGGLIHLMPGTAAALSAGLLALSALPPGLGFVSLWLSFQSILSAPRTGGLVAQLPLAAIAASLALTAALATAAAVRIAGIALLGRPRTPRGAGARESASAVRNILLALAALSILIGIFPNPVLWLLAAPAAHDLLGSAFPLGSIGSPNYAVPVVVALAALAAAAAIVLPKRPRQEPKVAGPWLDGFPPEVGLPFGEPSAQSAGAGFLPELPRFAEPPKIHLPSLPALPGLRGPWLILLGFAAFLLTVAVMG